MAENNTYTQIHIQIKNDFKIELYKYITGIVQQREHKLIAINGMSDHIHIFIGMRPNQSLSDLVKEIKSISSKWINEKKFLPYRFEWQDSFGAFSYSKSHIDAVVKYINNQEEHHKKENFKEEYIKFLEKFEIDYDEKYVFKDLI